ncbi:hypothetical protein HDV63DRAFT_402240 [Trichoderma sp. SZMC 28014]
MSKLPALPAVIAWNLNEAEQVHRVKNRLTVAPIPSPTLEQPYDANEPLSFSHQQESYTQSSLDYAECTEYPSRSPSSGGLHVKVQVLMDAAFGLEAPARAALSRELGSCKFDKEGCIVTGASLRYPQPRGLHAGLVMVQGTACVRHSSAPIALRRILQHKLKLEAFERVLY